MQLRRYWAVIARRWPIILMVVGLVLIGGGLMLALGARQYSAEVRLLINRVPIQAGGTTDFRYDDYYRFIATEYVLDDLVEEVRGNQFAEAVAARLQEQGIARSSREIEQSLNPDRAHRVLTIEVTAGTRQEALQMAAVVEELLARGGERYAPPDGSRVSARVIHRDDVATSNLLRSILTFALQVLLALLLGLGLALLLDYFDDRVRDSDDAEALGLPLLGRIPATNMRLS